MNEENQFESDLNDLGQAMGRRRVITYLLGFSIVATLGGVLTPVVSYLWPPSRAASGGSDPVQVGTVIDFPVGHGKVIPVHDKPVIVVNTAVGGIKAFSAICNHLGCIVEWDQERQFILCPCHDGFFNPVSGVVISGPPPAPLPQLEVRVSGDAIYVGG